MLASMAGLAVYSTSPGARGEAPEQWPADLPFSRSKSTPTAVLMMHPHCPCSRATMSELERLVAETGGRAVGFVLFFVPAGEDEAWAAGSLWERAKTLPGFEPRADPVGAMSASLGALTSGHLVIYGSSGAVRFSGGITPSRGHEGPSVGRRAALEALQEVGSSRDADVFGCPIQRSSNNG